MGVAPTCTADCGTQATLERAPSDAGGLKKRLQDTMKTIGARSSVWYGAVAWGIANYATFPKF